MGRTIKKHSLKKTASKTPYKRLLLMHRRLSSLIEEKESLEAKNLELVNSFNKEKKLASELRKEIFSWQRLYHEAIITLNAHKVKHADIMQNVASCLTDLNVALPHMVELTKVMCTNKTNLASQLNFLRAYETENSPPRAVRDGGQLNDSSKEKERGTKHLKVGPMVKGYPIQKPMIRLERVMLQPQSQEPANNDLSPTRAGDLSPITEGNEQDITVPLGQISMRRRRKHGLGSGERWKMRKQEQLGKDRIIEQKRKKENRFNSAAEDSSDSDTPLVPVIQLQRISDLLLSPNLLEGERGRGSEGKGTTGKPSVSKTFNINRRTIEDPLEGCSWTHVDLNTNDKKVSQKLSPSPVTTDSSDEETDTLNVVRKSSFSKLRDSLYKHQTAVDTKSSSCSSSADTSKEVSDLSRPEPDSTSNVLPQASLAEDYLGAVSRKHSCLDTSQLISVISRSHEKQKRCSNVSQNLGVASVATEESVRQSPSRKRSSGGRNNYSTIASPDVHGKRIRKRKDHSYPGEESVNTKTEVFKTKKGQIAPKVKTKVAVNCLSTGRKSFIKSSLKKSIDGFRGFSVSPSTAVDRPPSLGRPSKSLLKTKTSKKSSVKKSFETPRNSAISVDQSFIQGESNKTGSRRAKVPVSYKESPLNVKMRRPT